MVDKTQHRTSEIQHHHHNTAGAHPALKWIIAMIIGLISSIIFMLLLVAGLIEQAGGIGTTLEFKQFFVYTGGLILLQQAGNSILMFVLATLYYFTFFALIGLIIGYIVEWLVGIVQRS